MEKCPKCGADDNTAAQRYTPTRLDGPKAIHGRSFACGSTAWGDGKFAESTKCLRRQLAAANERAGRLEELRKDAWAMLLAIASGNGPFEKKMTRADMMEAARQSAEALEVPDAL